MLLCAHARPATARACSAPAPAGHPLERLVLHQPSGIEIRRKEFACLAPEGWVADEVINILMVLFLERDARRRRERAVGAGGRAGGGAEGPAASMRAGLVRSTAPASQPSSACLPSPRPAAGRAPLPLLLVLLCTQAVQGQRLQLRGRELGPTRLRLLPLGLVATACCAAPFPLQSACRGCNSTAVCSTARPLGPHISSSPAVHGCHLPTCPSAAAPTSLPVPCPGRPLDGAGAAGKAGPAERERAGLRPHHPARAPGQPLGERAARRRRAGGYEAGL